MSIAMVWKIPEASWTSLVALKYLMNVWSALEKLSKDLGILNLQENHQMLQVENESQYALNES